MDVGPRRDILGELNDAIKNTVSPLTNETIKFGVYHSLFEWYNLMFLKDQRNNFTTQEFVYQKTIPELYDLVNRYEPDLVWSDGEWSATSDYWNSREFINWYITESPVAKTAIWNDRWGNDVRCQYGSYLTCDDRYNPNQYQPKKFENAFTIDMTTWGYSRYSNYSTYMTVQQLIHTIIQVVAYNGNVLINIGPAADGTIHPIFVDRLLGIGTFMI
jgi:alpha-L-fucosidase